MSAAMTEDRRPGDTDMHRRQRGKNLTLLAILVAIALGLFYLTIVKIRGA